MKIQKQFAKKWCDPRRTLGQELYELGRKYIS